MDEEILETFNKAIRNEHGNRVTLDSLLIDADLDSFGITMVLLEMDDNYKYFHKGSFGEDPFAEIPYYTISIKEIIDICKLETTTTENQQ